MSVFPGAGVLETFGDKAEPRGAAHKRIPFTNIAAFGVVRGESSTHNDFQFHHPRFSSGAGAPRGGAASIG